MEKPVRTSREMTSSTSGGFEGGVMAMVLGDSDTRGVSIGHTDYTERGRGEQCRALFPKTPLLTITIKSLLIAVIYNQLNLNTYQQHISTIYHQQVITTRYTKNTISMYNFLFITDYNPWGFLATTK
jgi:hypothetical protein